MKISWKKPAIVAAIGTIILAMTAVVVFSQNPPPRPDGAPGPPPDGFHPRGPGGPGGPGEFRPLVGLNLTDAQKDQIKKIHESFEESSKALRDQMRTLHDNDTADPMSGNFDEAAFRSAAEARAKVQVEMEVQHAKMMSQVANVLTAEQKAQLAERHEQMRRMGPPKPPPPPEPEF
ncbi:MAG TPA: Spy/CpxP family protein refolding chaperone [Pyrinomonadaceae bacterium]|nr:Spy/CpxP family protein refolding chaperone [Pyrinomonadaceae bacterium]